MVCFILPYMCLFKDRVEMTLFDLILKYAISSAIGVDRVILLWLLTNQEPLSKSLFNNASLFYFVIIGL